MSAQSIAALCLNKGWLTEDTLRDELDKAAQSGLSLWTYLLRPDLRPDQRQDTRSPSHETAMLTCLAEACGLSFWPTIPELHYDAPLAHHYAFAWLRRKEVIPLRTSEGVVLAVATPDALNCAQDLSLLLHEDVRCVFAPKSAILEAQQQVFGQETQPGDAARGAANQVLDTLEAGEADILAPFEDDKVNDLLEESNDAPFIKLVNLVIAQAVKAKASDIHFEPYQDALRIRFRLDGVLYDRHELSRRYHAAITSRIKIMAKLNIAEKRLPQDGRIALALGGREVDLRVSSLPTAFGERIVLRLLEKSARVLHLEELGLAADDRAVFENTIVQPNGIVLVTGPTGSGKTTTLYAALNHINTPDKNILTIEDPIEYQVAGLGQMQVNAKIDLTFAAGLRTMLRQDPDVIFIGEIRDKETADIAIQAALTGHLVFSTLHTNDAPSAITRLIDMGVEPFLLASVLRTVLAQRLVRILCPHCKQPVRQADNILPLFEDDASALAGHTLYEPHGCKACLDTGYQGRKALYEIMPVTEPLKQAMLQSTDAYSLRQTALRYGMTTLRRDGCRKMAEGITSFAEVLRTVNQ